MGEPTPGDGPPISDASGWGGGLNRVAVLTAHFVANLDRYTPEALRTAALGAGYTVEEVEQALGNAATRRERQRTTAPLRTRARILVIAAYLLTYAVFAFAFLNSTNQTGFIDYGPLALGVLTVILAIALLIGILWVNLRSGSLAVMLVLPFVLLAGVSGLCLASAGSVIFGSGI